MGAWTDFRKSNVRVYTQYGLRIWLRKTEVDLNLCFVGGGGGGCSCPLLKYRPNFSQHSLSTQNTDNFVQSRFGASW